MPITNGKYVAPIWINGKSPAIDATELQAMSDTIESNQNSRGLNIVGDNKVTDCFSAMQVLTTHKSASINGIAYGGGIICAAAGDYGIVYNKNGFDWIATTQSSKMAGTLNDIAYGNGTFLAVGTDGKVSFTDPTGTWTKTGLPSGATTLNAVCYMSPYWYIGGAGGVYRSSDLTSWTTVLSGTCYDLDSTSGSRVYAAMSNGVYYSTSGSSWTGVSIPQTPVKKISSSSDGKSYVAIAGSGDETAAYYYNGSSTTTYSNPSPNYCSITDCVMLDDNKYIVTKWTDTETSTNYAKVLKNPFASSGTAYVDIYGATVTEITCAKVVNGEVYFGAPYGAVIRNAVTGEVVDSSGRVVIPAFYDNAILASYITDVKYSHIPDNDDTPTSYVGGIMTTYLDGHIVMDLRGSFDTTGTNALISRKLTMSSPLSVDKANYFYCITASINSGRAQESYFAGESIIADVTADNQVHVAVSSTDGTSLSSAFNNRPLRFSLHIVYIPRDKSIVSY